MPLGHISNKFGALRGDNTPSPALRGLRMITKALVVQWCSLSCLLEVEESQASSLLSLCMSLVLTTWEPFAWVPWGGLYRPTPRGTSVTWPGVGPGCQRLWSPASPPTAGARQVTGLVRSRYAVPAARGSCQLLITVAVMLMT